MNNDDRTLENLYKKTGLRLSYHFSETRWFVVGGTIKSQIFASLVESQSGKIIAPAKVEEAHHLNFAYVLWDGNFLVPGCLYLEVGITQERFKSQDVGFGSFKKKNLSPFVGAKFNVKLTEHSALAVEVWYINQKQLDFDSEFEGQRYAFKQSRMPVMFNLVFKF